jgi:ribosome biogenesis GTPase
VSDTASERGIVLSGTGGIWQVQVEGTVAGTVRDVTLRGRLKQTRGDVRKLTVGDRVVLEEDMRGGMWSVAEIEPRVSQLARREPGRRHGERIVVANVDQVLIVFAAANPEPHRRMLDRFLVIAEGNQLQARIVINKVELLGETAARARFADYIAAGYSVHFTSARQQLGLSELHDALLGRMSVLSGPSGVGKSSLLNAMYPGLNLRVGEISLSVNKGRHTTVGAMLHPLPDSGYVADTPGLREVGLWGLPPEHLDVCFPEFRQYLSQCRFGDCSHQHEPDCAVRTAVAAKAITLERYDSYVKLLGELIETERLRETHGR